MCSLLRASQFGFDCLQTLSIKNFLPDHLSISTSNKQLLLPGWNQIFSSTNKAWMPSQSLSSESHRPPSFESWSQGVWENVFKNPQVLCSLLCAAPRLRTCAYTSPAKVWSCAPQLFKSGEGNWLTLGGATVEKRGAACTVGGRGPHLTLYITNSKSRR